MKQHPGVCHNLHIQNPNTKLVTDFFQMKMFIFPFQKSPGSVFMDSNFANPYPDGSFGPHPPNPPPDTHQQIFDVPYPPWLVPKYKEYTTKCCTTMNVSSTDQSNAVTRGT